MIEEKTKKEIRKFYLEGKGSIQDYARIYRLSVDEVLDIVGEKHLKTVQFSGDLIDAEEAGPATQLSHGEQYRVPYSTN